MKEEFLNVPLFLDISRVLMKEEFLEAGLTSRCFTVFMKEEFPHLANSSILTMS